MMNSRIMTGSRSAFILSFALLGAAGLSQPVSALALDVYSCGVTIDSTTTNAILKANLSYSGSGACLEVKNGRNLNLNGFTITCTAGSCGQAVNCPTTDTLNVGSLIQSTNASDGGHTDINGPFAAGVKNCGTVQSLKIVGATTGVLFDDANTNAQDITRNVIEPSSAGTGIDVKIEDSGDQISDNLVKGGAVGLFLRKGRQVSLGSQVKENILRGYSDAGIQSTVTSYDYFRINNNSIIEGGTGSVPFDVAGSHPTFSGNICQDEVPDLGHCACKLDPMTPATAGSCPL